MMKKKNFKNKAFIAFFVCILLAILLLNDPFHTYLDETDVEIYTDQNRVETPIPDTLKVMTWNIKFGGGRIDFFFDCFGDRVIMTEKEVIDNMEGLASIINQYQPDILFLQEVDIQSKRSALINQLQWLLNYTDLNFGVYAPQWKASYIPSKGIGQMNSGNAILSKWELKNPKRISLPLFEDQNWLVRYFYLRRNILTTELTLDGQNYFLANTHLAAYSHDGTKKKQLDILLHLLNSTDSHKHTFIAGGDFNSLPPGTQKVKGFPDDVCTDAEFSEGDYSQETDYLTPFYRFEAAIPLSDYKANNAPYFTHTTQGPASGGFWNRKIDYLFTNGHFARGSGLTHQDENSGGMNTMDLSDHAPLSVQFVKQKNCTSQDRPISSN
jgi:endonuclease/exonuclease/phosphatase family metal-dependent hydrolase